MPANRLSLSKAQRNKPVSPNLPAGEGFHILNGPQLQPINSEHRQHPLQDRHQADQDNEQFEKICQPAITDELVDDPETDRTNDTNDQNAE